MALPVGATIVEMWLLRSLQTPVPGSQVSSGHRMTTCTYDIPRAICRGQVSVSQFESWQLQSAALRPWRRGCMLWETCLPGCLPSRLTVASQALPFLPVVSFLSLKDFSEDVLHLLLVFKKYTQEGCTDHWEAIARGRSRVWGCLSIKRPC